VIWGSVGFIFLLLVLWGGTHALREWWGILLLGGLIALGVVALRRETLKEFPSTVAVAGAPAGAIAAPPAGGPGAQEDDRSPKGET
jgi:hypothetical protein